MTRCAICGKPMRGVTRRRRFALWLRARLERLAYRVDAATAPRYDPDTWPHLHLSDGEWADLEEAIS